MLIVTADLSYYRLPIIVFRLAGSSPGSSMDLEVFPSSYLEFHKDGGGSAGGAGRYTPRIYLTEGSGAVLGANAINEHNVIFDPDGLRVGFARSSCRYDKKHSQHDFATSTNAVAAASSKPDASAAPKEKKGKSSPGKEKGSSSEAEARSAEIPKKSAKKPPAADSGSVAALLATTTKTAGTLPATKAPLAPAQQAAMDAVVAASARTFVASRHAACKPVLAIPCDARCDHSPFSEPVDGTASGKLLPLSALIINSYLTTDAFPIDCDCL